MTDTERFLLARRRFKANPRPKNWPGFELVANGEAIECKNCGMQSFNSKDVEYRYCAYCNVFHTDSVAGE